jgi:hypothetical protein
VSALAHVFEQAGIATVGISSIRAQAEASRAPRILHCEFPLGRPLGQPGDTKFQHRVLAAAFDLLPRRDVPVLADFPDTIADESDQPLACTIPLRHDDSVHPAINEVRGLRAAYDRQLAATGRTMVSRLGNADRVAELVSVFTRIADGTPYDNAGLPAPQIGQAAMDIRAYFEEAAQALAGHVPGARQAESWFYRSTKTGALLKQVRAIAVAADAPRPVWFPIVPVGQQE